LQVIRGDGSNTWGNPCPVQDRDTGAIHLLLTHNAGTDAEAAIIAGNSQSGRTVWVMRSEDDGISWIAPREITEAVKQPDWAWYATGPGVGIQMASGRLIVPCDHIGREGRSAASHIIFSDDHGSSWYPGGSVIGAATNECQVVERGDGSLLLNMRSHDPAVRCRLIATSDDGGWTWSDAQPVPELIDPVCQASMIRTNGGMLVFANPASETQRHALTVRFSDDDGTTWQQGTVLHAGPAAYSSLAEMPDGLIGCLFECGEAEPYERIDLIRFDVYFQP
jgi:sialidase-1